MHSDAATVEEYLESLPEDRRAEMQAVLDIVRPHLPEGVEERMDFGMITWSVPLEILPDTYNGKPLMYGGLASQKHKISLYLMSLYAGAPISEEEFRERWNGAKKLDMGKSCVRFKSVADIDVPLITETLSGVTMEEYVEKYNSIRTERRKR